MNECLLSYISVKNEKNDFFFSCILLQFTVLLPSQGEEVRGESGKLRQETFVLIDHLKARALHG